MQDDCDSDYYRRREAVARDTAARSNDVGVARIHLQMAEMYAEKADQAARPKLKINTPR